MGDEVIQNVISRESRDCCAVCAPFGPDLRLERPEGFQSPYLQTHPPRVLGAHATPKESAQEFLPPFLFLWIYWNPRIEAGKMVHIPHFIPEILMVYSTVPLTPAITTSVQNDYYVGSFARFQDPFTVLSISNRTDFHNLSHFQIRQTLDRENKTDLFFLIDSRTLDSHAIWYVETREHSLGITEDIGPGPDQPRSYANESYVLWQSRMLTQDVSLAWINLDIYNIDFTDVVVDAFPYDPHDPQPIPYTLGLDFSTEEGASGFYGPAYVTAPGREILWTNSTNETSRFMPRPHGVIRLTPAAATGAGLLSQWAYGPRRPFAANETSYDFPQDYDWNSPVWPPNPVINVALPPRRTNSRLGEGGQSLKPGLVTQPLQSPYTKCSRYRLIAAYALSAESGERLACKVPNTLQTLRLRESDL